MAFAACTSGVVGRPQIPANGFGWWGDQGTPETAKSAVNAVKIPNSHQHQRGDDSFGFGSCSSSNEATEPSNAALPLRP